MKPRLLITALIAVLAACVASARAQVAPNQVRLCEHNHHSGLCHSFYLEPHMRHRLVRKLPPSIDNKTTSIQSGDGVVLFVFRHPHFQGANRVFSSVDHFPAYGPPALKICGSYGSGFVWNDQISSIILTRTDRRCNDTTGISPLGWVEGVYLSSALMKNAECPEAYYPLAEDAAKNENRYPDLGPYMNNHAETAYLCGQLEVELYPEPHFKGTPVTIRGGETVARSEFQLEDFGLEHKVSSMIIRSLGGPIKGIMHLAPPERGGEAAGEPHRAPPVVATPAIIPGEIVQPGSPSLALQYDSNRPGHDYKNFDLPQARPELCRDQCAQDPRCKAFTYVSPGLQGPSARCWLKDMASPPQRVKGLVSGVKHNLSQP